MDAVSDCQLYIAIPAAIKKKKNLKPFKVNVRSKQGHVPSFNPKPAEDCLSCIL